MSILVKFSKNFDFGQNLRKIPIFQNFRKISIWVKSLKNFDFGQIFEKFRFWSKFFKIFDLFENFEKFRFRFFVKIFHNFRCIRKLRTISILVKFSKNSDFGQNFENNVRGQIFEKNLDFRKIFEKFRFWSKFWK